MVFCFYFIESVQRVVKDRSQLISYLVKCDMTIFLRLFRACKTLKVNGFYIFTNRKKVGFSNRSVECVLQIERIVN